MRQPLIAGNWKMNGSRASIKELLDGLKAGIGEVKTAEVAVCPPYVYLADVQARLEGTPIAWGGQNLSTEPGGAFTGEISADMLLDFGCKYVIVGHSERRTLYGEDDALVARKYAVARAAGLIPILCVGETLEERENGTTEAVVARQLKAVIDREGIEALADGVIAYEPVWAIGTGQAATPEIAADVMGGAILDTLKGLYPSAAGQVPLLYGGSVNPGNAAAYAAESCIHGSLVGGAALRGDQFLEIARITAEAKTV